MENGLILKGNKFDEENLIKMFKSKKNFASMSSKCSNQFINYHSNHYFTANFYRKLYKQFIY